MEKLVIGGLYEHWKGGKYVVLHRAWESTNRRPRKAVVVYLSLTFGHINVRDEAEFLGMTPDMKYPRFKLIPKEEQQ